MITCSMANPDGVYNGMGALTAPRGADVCFIPYEPDEVMRSMKEAIDQVRRRSHRSSQLAE